jgi:phage shock protein PspC (stress-responsive transcriptional regulator)
VAERLYRSRDDRMLAGVAAGVAETLDADPSIIRIAWALLTIFTGGIALIVYIVMAIVVPEAPDDWAPAQPAPPVPPVDPVPPAPTFAETAGSPAPPMSADAAPFTAPAPPSSAPPIAPPPPSWAAGYDNRRAARRARREAREPGRGGLIAGIVLIVLGGAFLIREFVPWFDWHVWWPVGLIALGGLLLLLALRPGSSSD